MPARRLAVVAALVLAPPAHAGTIAVDRACHVAAADEHGDLFVEPATVTGTGYEPMQPLTLSIAGKPVAELQADRDGAFRAESLPLPRPRGAPPRTVEVAATGGATTRTKVVALGVVMTPRRARPSDRVEVVGRGFMGGGTLHAHYVRRGRHVRTVEVGVLRGACGTASRRMRQVPLQRPRPGPYVVQYDQYRRYDAGRIPQARLRIRVYAGSPAR